MLDKNGPSAHAGAWALGWLAGDPHWKTQKTIKKIWLPKQNEIEKLIDFISDPNADIEAVSWSIGILGIAKNPLSVDTIIERLDDTHGRVSFCAVDALGRIGAPRAVDPLIKKLDDKNGDVRRAALGALAKIREDKNDQKLLSAYIDIDDFYFSLDPQESIDEKRVKKAAKKLKMNEDEVRQRYERLAEKYKLKLSWRAQ